MTVDDDENIKNGNGSKEETENNDEIILETLTNEYSDFVDLYKTQSIM